MNDGGEWHLRQLWQFAKNRGYSVKLEGDRIWLTPSEQGSTREGGSFPGTRAGMQAARTWLSQPSQPAVLQSVTAQDGRQPKTGSGPFGGVGVVIGWIVGFVVVIALFNGLAAWWNDNHYPSEYDNNFLTTDPCKGK